MKLDNAMKEAFDRDVRGTAAREPRNDELARAVPAAVAGRPGHKPSGLAPALALAAACLAAAFVAPAGGGLRPLARELSRSLPDDSGDRFVSFILLAGDSLRSADTPFAADSTD